MDEHVGAVEQSIERAAAERVFEIEHHAALATIEPDEIGAEAVDRRVVLTCEVAAARALDLHHIRAKIGKMAGRERRGHRVLPGHHADTFERQQARSSADKPLFGRCRSRPNFSSKFA